MTRGSSPINAAVTIIIIQKIGEGGAREQEERREEMVYHGDLLN